MKPVSTVTQPLLALVEVHASASAAGSVAMVLSNVLIVLVPWRLPM